MNWDQDKPETETVAAIVGIVAEAKRYTAVLRIGVPTTTANDAVLAT
jgi:hypothetical protein